ncbi:hypothetical protein BDR06DRAFT_611426 [Suillus hirtellus]|nr:hypothetical protein BDR06DRAFT_611426 [Suillus hirtellus]
MIWVLYSDCQVKVRILGQHSQHYYDGASGIHVRSLSFLMERVGCFDACLYMRFILFPIIIIFSSCNPIRICLPFLSVVRLGSWLSTTVLHS